MFIAGMADVTVRFVSKEGCQPSGVCKEAFDVSRKEGSLLYSTFSCGTMHLKHCPAGSKVSLARSQLHSGPIGQKHRIYSYANADIKGAIRVPVNM